MKLRDYQETYVERCLAVLKQRGLCYMAAETRTGKTIMSLTVADRFGAFRVLFLTKKAARSSIRSDQHKMRCYIDLDIVSIDSAHKVDGSKYDLVIIDEAHCLGAFPKPSGRAKKVKHLVKSTPVIFLSATPTPESWSQIYHQLNCSNHSPFIHYRNFYAWAKDFVTVRDLRLGVMTVKDYSLAHVDDIKRIVAPLMLTLTQEEAGFTQEISEHFLRVSINPNLHNLIRKLVRERYHKFRDGGEIICDSPASLMQKCHQLSGGTVLDANSVPRYLDPTKALAIRDKFKGRKIAVFYKFVAEFEILKTVFPNWTNNPDIFRQERDVTFLGQFASSREGLELSAADCIVFYSVDYPYLSYAQAKERIQKIDRVTRPELWFVFSDTGLEEKILTRVKSKHSYTSRWFMKDWGAA